MDRAISSMSAAAEARYAEMQKILQGKTENDIAEHIRGLVHDAVERQVGREHLPLISCSIPHNPTCPSCTL